MADGKERKKPINSKQKGSEFERKVAKALSSWWSEEFHRTPMSGGLHWKDDNRVAGDIVTPPDSVYPWTTECKKREGWLLEQVLKGTGEVEKWWAQSVRDGERVNLKPLLIFSKNFSPTYLMVSLEDFTAITVAKKNRVPFNFFIISVLGQTPRVVCDFDDFLRGVSKEDILEAFNLKEGK